MKKDFDGRKSIRGLEAVARELRAERRGFSGLEVPFASIQEGMIRDFKQSAIIDHPGDKGSAREDILRNFFAKKRYLPGRFGVSTGSSHVMSSSGEMSAQMDLVFYDEHNSPRLLDLGHIQYFPVECVYGVMEIKSDLNSKERVTEGLSRISSFKKLYKNQLGAERLNDDSPRCGFGILFAYDCSMQWSTLVDTVTKWQTERPGVEWPNMIVVLNQGILVQSDGARMRLHTGSISEIVQPQLSPVLDDGDGFLKFYLLLMDLLTSIELPRFSPRRYVRLPVRVDGRLVRFPHGSISEIETCVKHGAFLRELQPGAVDRILQTCRAQKAISAKGVMYEIFGELWGESSADQDSEVFIYNPEEHRLSDVLLVDKALVIQGKVFETKGFVYDVVLIDAKLYWLPSYYVVKHRLISGCGKCPMSEPTNFSIEDWQSGFRAEMKMKAQSKKSGDE